MKSSIRNRRLRLSAALALGVLVVFTGSFVAACNVPVFRYALEHWHPDAYRAVLFHRGPLSNSDQARLDGLRNDSGKRSINLVVRTVDLDESVQPADAELLSALRNPDVPRLVVQYPAYLQIDRPVWSGPLGETELSALLDSPLRREVLLRLAAGQTAVWLMVDSGDAGQDAAAAATLELELKNLQQTLKLPELTDSPEDVIQNGPPLRVEFSLVRVRRDDPAEQPLVAMLLGSEPDLGDLTEPLVFPVFGRSRALLPLVGSGISPENIRGSAAFLAGACSCQVKQLNPGFDLLLTADWKELLSWANGPASAAAEPAEANSSEPVLVTIPGGSKPQPVPQVFGATGPTAPASSASNSTPAGAFTWALTILGGIALAGAVVAVRRRQQHS